MMTPSPAMPATDIAAARGAFAATRAGVYVNAAERAILYDDTVATLRRMIDAQAEGVGGKAVWVPMLDAARAEFAAMINADAADIAITKNVSEGLNIIANAVDWKQGDNVVLCRDLEQPNNVYAWLNLRRFGVEVRSVPGRDGDIDADALIAAIDGRTRVVTASTVTFSPGFRGELAALGHSCRERGVFFMVDAAQSTGVLETDVEALGVDGLATSSSKGLLGPLGACGFLYCRPAWAERLQPAYLAHLSVDHGGAHASVMGGDDWRLMPGARRFEIGNYPWAAVAATGTSLAFLQRIGVRRIEDHAVGLATRLADGLADIGLPVTCPPPGRRRSHIVTVGRLGGGGAQTTDDPRLNRVAQALREAGVVFSVRRGLLRFGFHVYNAEEDVAAVLDIARRSIDRAAA